MTSSSRRCAIARWIRRGSYEPAAGHSPFFTHPVELADLLETLA